MNEMSESKRQGTETEVSQAAKVLKNKRELLQTRDHHFVADRRLKFSGIYANIKPLRRSHRRRHKLYIVCEAAAALAAYKNLVYGFSCK